MFFPPFFLRYIYCLLLIIHNTRNMPAVDLFRRSMYQHAAQTIDCGGTYATRLHHLEKSPTDSVLASLVLRVAKTIVHLDPFDISKFEH